MLTNPQLLTFIKALIKLLEMSENELEAQRLEFYLLLNFNN